MMLTKMFLIVLLSIVINANDEEIVEQITSADCMSCHNTEDFTHKSEKITDFKKLHEQVSNCAFNNDAGWFDDETLDVTKHLNKKHYFFKEN